MAQQADVVIIGAGAAGLMCAIQAGQRGRTVVVLERADKIGKKILISGGGRCNFTNLGADATHFISKNPHFCKSALARYPAHSFIKLVEKHGIPYHEKKLGQLFCDHTAQAITQLLQSECSQAKVKIQLNTTVTKVEKQNQFLIYTPQQTYQAQSLVIATGGLSIPKMGATDFGLQIAQQFGLSLAPCRPALVPLTWAEPELKHFQPLAGIALEAVVSYQKTQFRENILFTHQGLSGPAILQISSYWQPQTSICIDLLMQRNLLPELKKVRDQNRPISQVLHNYFPKRFVQQWLSYKNITNTTQLSNAQLQKLCAELGLWHVQPAGTEGYPKAEVTAGGVNTDELSSQTLAAKKVPGLFFIGEVVDVTGHLGGYNFQWAWSSGYAAGQVC